MKTIVLLAVLEFLAGAANACVPPPGLSPQQWYSMCRNDMEQGFALGVGGRQSHDQFMLSMYQMYRSAHATYNPQIQQSQDQLRTRMAEQHGQFMDQFTREGNQRTGNFNNYEHERDWRQNNEMNYIQNRHCAVWDTAHTFCLSVPN